MRGKHLRVAERWAAFALTSLLLCVSAGCSPVQRLYAGKPLPVAQVSRVYNTDQVEVMELDGAPVPRPGAVDSTTLVYEFQPGHHRMHVVPAEKSGPGDDSAADFDVEFRGGHSYTFAVSDLRGPGKRDWRVVLVDYHTEQPVAAPVGSPGLHDPRPLLGLP